MNKYLANWKTTLPGIGAILVAVGHILMGSPGPADYAAILIGFGLVTAKDA